MAPTATLLVGEKAGGTVKIVRGSLHFASQGVEMRVTVGGCGTPKKTTATYYYTHITCYYL